MGDERTFARNHRSRGLEATDALRHSLLVRITHWITTLGFLALLGSGIAILLAHPRLYWGETGMVGEPSLIDLPLPFVLTGQTGWGRSLRFLAAWILVLNGLIYVRSACRRNISGISSFHPGQI